MLNAMPTEMKPLNGLNVLVVDDAEDNQNLVSCALSFEGAHVSIASNGQDGVEAALRSPFDVILMDIQMPKMNGYEATALLRKHGYIGPIIALTASNSRTEMDRCLEAGCNAYTHKPITLDELGNVILKWGSRK